MTTEPSEREEAPTTIVSVNSCPVSTHKFKLHDWRWLGWPLSNPSSSGRWCCLCGLAQGEPEGQCQTANCLRYAAGGNDFCGFCQQTRAVNDAATRMRERCVARVKEIAAEWLDKAEWGWGTRVGAAKTIADALESLTLEGTKEQ